VPVTIQDGAPFKGPLLKEDEDRLVVDTGAAEVEIRKGETATVLRARRSAKPPDKP
jgi:hypothetical protein